jgi:hypothetical protein
MRPAKLALAARYHRTHGRTDLPDRLEAELHAASRCRMCGRTLTDPDSIAAGIGPDCAQRDRGAQAHHSVPSPKPQDAGHAITQHSADDRTAPK